MVLSAEDIKGKEIVVEGETVVGGTKVLEGIKVEIDSRLSKTRSLRGTVVPEMEAEIAAEKVDIHTHVSDYQTIANLDPAASSSSRELPFLLDKAAIVVDLSSEKPQWPLSAYGPGRYAPAQLFGGPLREQSFEEMRLLHYMGVAVGNPQGPVSSTS